MPLLPMPMSCRERMVLRTGWFAQTLKRKENRFLRLYTIWPAVQSLGENWP